MLVAGAKVAAGAAFCPRAGDFFLRSLFQKGGGGVVLCRPRGQNSVELRMLFNANFRQNPNFLRQILMIFKQNKHIQDFAWFFDK